MSEVEWAVVQRSLAEAMAPADAERAWMAVVMDVPSLYALGTAVGERPASAQQALAAATAAARARGAAYLPRRLLTSPDLAEPLAAMAAALGAEVVVRPIPEPVRESVNWVVGAVTGGDGVADLPTPSTWRMLYQAAAGFAAAAPWKRWADDVHFQIQLDDAGGDGEWVAVVTGNAGIQRGLVLCRGTAVPAELEDEGAQPPLGTCAFQLDAASPAAKAGLREARRYGWTDALVPGFRAVGIRGIQRLNEGQARILAAALEVTVALHQRSVGVGEAVSGELAREAGPVRWRAVVAPNHVMAESVRLVSTEMRDDLLPERRVQQLSAVRWSDLTEIRGRAARHQAPDRPTVEGGDGLPVLFLGMGAEKGREVAAMLEAAHPEGIVAVEGGGMVELVLLCRSVALPISRMAASTPGLARFRRRLARAGQWHAIVVTSREMRRSDPVYGFFECVLGAWLAEPGVTRRRPARSGLGRGV
jgi:hypothetical protein